MIDIEFRRFTVVEFDVRESWDCVFRHSKVRYLTVIDSQTQALAQSLARCDRIPRIRHAEALLVLAEIGELNLKE